MSPDVGQKVVYLFCDHLSFSESDPRGFDESEVVDKLVFCLDMSFDVDPYMIVIAGIMICWHHGLLLASCMVAGIAQDWHRS